MKYCRLPGEKGLTLLEMVMASFILFLVSISLIELFVFGLSAVKWSRIFSTTTFLAAGAAERLLPVPADSLSTTPDPFPMPFDPEYQTAIPVSSYDSQLKSCNCYGHGFKRTNNHLFISETANFICRSFNRFPKQQSKQCR